MESPYGLAYGLGQMGSVVPNAVMHGEEIRRRRAIEDSRNAQAENENDYKQGLMDQEKANRVIANVVPTGPDSGDPNDQAISAFEAQMEAAKTSNNGIAYQTALHGRNAAVASKAAAGVNSDKAVQAKEEAARIKRLTVIRNINAFGPGSSLSEAKKVFGEMFDPQYKGIIDGLSWEKDSTGKYTGKINLPDGDGNMHPVDPKAVEDLWSKPLGQQYAASYGNMENSQEEHNRKVEKDKVDAAVKVEALNLKKEDLAWKKVYQSGMLGLMGQKVKLAMDNVAQGKTDRQTIARMIAKEAGREVSAADFVTATEIVKNPSPETAGQSVWKSLYANDFKFQKLSEKDQAAKVQRVLESFGGSVKTPKTTTPAPATEVPKANPKAASLY